MTSSRRGLLYAVAAYGMWGLVPLYWKLVNTAGAVEILAHRIVWSTVVVGLLLLFLRNAGPLRALLRDRRRLLGVTAAAVIISVNWGVYIFGVIAGRVVETSLGYFINPLVSVALGVVFFRERLRVGQWAAVAIAGVAVGVITVDYGHPPWIALTLAGSFATYGAVKKQLGLPPVESLFVESAVMTLPALGFLGFLQATGEGTFATVSWTHSLLLAGAGLITAVPLLFFGGAAIRLPLSMMGMLQYLAPILQFAIGVAVYREAMPTARWAGFALVWAALAVFTVDALRNARRAAVVAAVAPGPVTTPVSR